MVAAFTGQSDLTSEEHLNDAPEVTVYADIKFGMPIFFDAAR